MRVPGLVKESTQPIILQIQALETPAKQYAATDLDGTA